MGFFKRRKLEKQLMEEIKASAGVAEFPLDDAKVIAKALAAYNNGNLALEFALMPLLDVLEKYPRLEREWDNIMVKYKKLGLFPNWHILVADNTWG